MAGNSTVDTKPHSLHLHEARPHARSAPWSSPQPTFENAAASGFQYPFSSGFNYPNPFMMPPMPMPMFYNQGPGQNLGTSHPFLGPQYLSIPQATNSCPSAVEYPEVTRWFHFLDEHEERRKDGIGFAAFGDVLKNKGFLRITQLTLDFITLKDLQDWLGIEVGTAILIMQYAKDDIESIKAGRLIIPW